ncbi:MAG: site-specific integrase [Bacteroidetes bacterium]|uniref:Site-specific integrase n=1 Tax=Candidatus Cryptobacteroides faecavium TaxID=2840762 RepID=A0A9D9IFK2_9BACT|nr:site-specific integrase [Candidatus Cryptobacteroides faecavium]
MKQKTLNISFVAWIEHQASELKEAGRLGTARNYRRTCSSFLEFISQSGSTPSWPDEVTILKYNSWLQRRGVVRNTISFYMRVLRAVYNKAVDCGIIKQKFPFSHVYTGIDKTRKRAVDEDLIGKIISLDLLAKPSLALARDMFIFSYCTRGMSFVDMAFLRKKNIKGNILLYSRKKTGQNISVRIEPNARVIIDKYIRDSSEYIFPIIKTCDPEAAFRQYQTALGYFNRNLKMLSFMAGSCIMLSSYTARHSWASNARKHNIPVSVISAGMGHDSEKTTRIYLSSLDSSMIDTANRKILSSLEKYAHKC